MKKLSEKQKARLQELTERNETLDQIIIQRITDHSQALPLNLILEARFNELMKKGIALEGEIAYLKESDDYQFVEGQIEVKKRRLDMIKGQIAELQNVGDMLAQYHAFGREFEIIIS
jgi:hypothetical protein